VHRLALIALLLTACGSVAPKPGKPEANPPAAPQEVFRHPASGMEFPAALGTLERDVIRTYDATGDDVSVGYHRTDHDVTLVITVYIYPRRRPLDDEFAGAKAAIEARSAGATLITQGLMQLEQGGSIHTGRRAHYLIRDPSGQSQTQISHLFLFDQGPWHVKYRVTFIAEQHELADELVLQFMRQLAWPEVATAPLALALRPRVSDL